MHLDIHTSLFSQNLFGILWRRYAICFLLSLTLSVHRALSDPDNQFDYNIGDYSVDCPSNWLNVDARCFRVIDQNIYGWNEAVFTCAQSV